MLEERSGLKMGCKAKRKENLRFGKFSAYHITEREKTKGVVRRPLDKEINMDQQSQ